MCKACKEHDSVRDIIFEITSFLAVVVSFSPCKVVISYTTAGVVNTFFQILLLRFMELVHTSSSLFTMPNVLHQSEFGPQSQLLHAFLNFLWLINQVLFLQCIQDYPWIRCCFAMPQAMSEILRKCKHGGEGAQHSIDEWHLEIGEEMVKRWILAFIDIL